MLQCAVTESWLEMYAASAESLELVSVDRKFSDRFFWPSKFYICLGKTAKLFSLGETFKTQNVFLDISNNWEVEYIKKKLLKKKNETFLWLAVIENSLEI